MLGEEHGLRVLRKIFGPDRGGNRIMEKTAQGTSSYLLTPWSRVLLEKLTSYQLAKKFLASYRTRTFIAAFTSARHVPLS